MKMHHLPRKNKEGALCPLPHIKGKKVTSNTSILLEAHNLINGERQQTYGDAKVGLTNVADQWSMYLRQKYGIDIPISPEDVCWMMSDIKKIRQFSKSKRDNIVDAAGYLGLIERVY